MADGQLSNTPHPTPPRAEEDRLDWLRLIRSRRVGAVTFHRLRAEHGSVRAALCALPGIAAAAGLRDYHPCSTAAARDEMARARALGARLVCFDDADYPAPLRELPDAPPLFWARGELGLLRRPMVALVGARNASSLGLRMARRLALGLGEAGFVVVSGLARGIDAAAHRSALDSGTVAVQAGGVDVVYPDENAALAGEIAARGLCLSEHPPGTAPQARHFPLRNRIVSGLSRAVVVVEAAARSGSLLTARMALDQGREVLAVPGHPFDARAAGCNMLIRDGATLARDAADVLEAIGGAGHVVHGPGYGGEGARPDPLPGDRPAAMVRAPESASEDASGGNGSGSAPGCRGIAPRGVPERRVREGVGVDSAVSAQNVAAAGQDASAGRLSAAARPAAPSSAALAPRAALPAAPFPAAESPAAVQPVPSPSIPSPSARPMIETAALHRLILDRLGPSPLAEDQLIRDLDLPAARLSCELLMLELEGLIQRQPGGLLSRL